MLVKRTSFHSFKVSPAKASRELKDEEKEKLEGTVIATDGIAVIVNKANPTEEMTSDQVKSIYLGDVLTWDEIAE